MIRLDSTQISVVVLCTQCPWWHGFGDTRDEGWRVGAAHEKVLHPEQDQARNTLDKRASRARKARHAVSALSGVRSRAERTKREPVEAEHPEPSTRRHGAGARAVDQEP